MKRYVIERHIPGIGGLDTEQLRAASQRSMNAIRQLGFQIQWEHSYLAADQSFCTYLANDLQADSQGKAKEANWLPAPKARSIPMMRLYWPKDTPPSIIDGRWKPPAITEVK